MIQKLFISIFVFFFSQSFAYSKVLLLKGDSSIEWSLIDSVSPNLILSKYATGQMILFDSDQKTKQFYSNQCDLKFSPWNRPVFVYPYLLNITSNCRLNDRMMTVDSMLKNLGPKDAFSITFLGSLESVLYFAINSRPWSPPAPYGFIHVKAIDSSNNLVRINTVIDQVPGYSGAMSLDVDRKSLLYTQATYQMSNLLHSIQSDELIKAFESGTQIEFAKVSKNLDSFSGMSMWMSVSEDWLLYGEDESYYFLDRKNYLRQDFRIEPGCEPVGFIRTRLLIKCADHGLYFHQ